MIAQVIADTSKLKLVDQDLIEWIGYEVEMIDALRGEGFSGLRNESGTEFLIFDAGDLRIVDWRLVA